MESVSVSTDYSSLDVSGDLGSMVTEANKLISNNVILLDWMGRLSKALFGADC